MPQTATPLGDLVDQFGLSQKDTLPDDVREVYGTALGATNTELTKVLHAYQKERDTIEQDRDITTAGKRRRLDALAEKYVPQLDEIADKQTTALEKEIPGGSRLPDHTSPPNDVAPEVVELRAREIRDHLRTLDNLQRSALLTEATQHGESGRWLLVALEGDPMASLGQPLVPAVQLTAARDTFHRTVQGEDFATADAIGSVIQTIRRNHDASRRYIDLRFDATAAAAHGG